MNQNHWIWWITVILLILRSTSTSEVSLEKSNESPPENNSTETVEDDQPKSANSLGVPRCETNYDCAHNGVCKKGDDGYGICLCPKTCPSYVQPRCNNRAQNCMIMDESYRSKYDLINPACYSSMCVCPPMFDPIHVSPDNPPLRLNASLPPFKCDKRDLQVIGMAYPSNSVYKGRDVTLFCCINIDPEGFVDAAGVFFIQNTTLVREASNHPFREEYQKKLHERMACWELEIKNAQPSDSGSYMCMVTTSVAQITANHTIEFEVKAPRMIQNLRVNATEKNATITWQSEEGTQIPIDLRLLRRTDNRGQEVFRRENATSPVLVEHLRAATPYTLFVSGKDGANNFELTEHFTTQQKRPHAPKEEDVRVLNSGSSLICEVEWKSPAETNGRITKYFVSVRGGMRRSRPDGALVADDFPVASDSDKRCANWDGTDTTVNDAFINPIEFSNEFYSCKYGPLKPNRNYSVHVWAENNAGRSQPAVFKKTCLTNYAQPDIVEEPTTAISGNQSTFLLSFKNAPDDTNGPISCFYVAVVPLLVNVSLDSLPPPSEIVMDSFSRAFSNNLNTVANEKKRYFAYIAESYSDYPTETVIGDGIGANNIRPCNVQYLSRYSAEDLALRTGLKYTGFLIVRVDKEEDKMDKLHGSKFLKGVLDRSRAKNGSRTMRQLHLNGPAYGYSGYFKPILLQGESGSSSLATIAKVLLPVLVFLVMATAVGVFILHARGDVVLGGCPLARLLAKDIPDRAQLKPTYLPIPVDELPQEYIMRHRDSDFMFSTEYESLPHYTFEAAASAKKENSSKNRYNDIRAFDDTRVKLCKVEGDEHSDYINANYIQSWNGKKTFIAAQAPLEATIPDFWRMIWEQESYLIVMVANLTEKNRQQCSKYWPDDATMMYGDIMVRPVGSEKFYSDYTVRTFDVTNTASNRFSPTPSFGASAESNASSEYANVPVYRNSRAETSFSARRIVQYHFKNWNDYKAPECSAGLLRFIHILRGLPQFNEHPVVIHCSAGVGRTGTLMTIDSMLDQCQAESKADIYGFVTQLRRQRNLMVQSLEQYVFIYKALAEWHLYGFTDVDANDFTEHYHMLVDPSLRNRAASFNGLSRVVARPDTVVPANGLEEEFQKLNRSVEGTPRVSFASKEENILKNRQGHGAAVPYDRNRVILSPAIGFADSTYINASHIKGYFFPYIVAQDPVSDVTVFDFWRMIADHNVATIVMLSNEDEWSLSEKYWPEEVNSTVVFRQGRNVVEVRLVAENVYPHFTERRINFNMKGVETSHTEVVQYVFTAWPGTCAVPPQSDPLLNLISVVLTRQTELPDSSPILCHCRNGSSETGVYCCISLLLCRLKAENRVDVFQTVKGLQNQRAEMFKSFEQYAFCYRAVRDYLLNHGSSSHR